MTADIKTVTAEEATEAYRTLIRLRQIQYGVHADEFCAAEAKFLTFIVQSAAAPEKAKERDLLKAKVAELEKFKADCSEGSRDLTRTAIELRVENDLLKARCAELEGRVRAFRSAAEDAIVALDRTKRQSDAIAGLYVLLDPPSDRIESCRPFSFAEETVCEMVERLRARALTGGGNG